MKLNKQNKKGFTIVELVIVIAVIGILSAILIPTFANLTTQAQEAAAKQQVADAYTAYLVEASDGKFDTVVYESTATSATACTDENVKERATSIQNKSQAEVALKLNTQWYTYDAEKGWENKGTAAQGTNLVVTLATNADGYTGSYLKAAANSYSDTDATKLSTFNGVEVYLKTAA